MNPKAVSYLNLAICILLWASIPVASRKILAELTPYQTLFYTHAASALAVGLVLLVQRKVRALLSYSLPQYGILLLLGFLGMYLYYLLLYSAFARTTASEGFLLAYTWPALILVLAFVLLKEKVTARKLLAVVACFFGIVVIVTQGELRSFRLTNLWGDLLALLGAFVFALYSVLGKKFRFDKTSSVFVFFLVAALCSWLTLLPFGPIPWPSASIWGWILYNGVLVNGISNILWFRALEHGETQVISCSLYLTPFLSLITISFFLGEPVLASSVVGLAIIVGGILAATLKPS